MTNWEFHQFVMDILIYFSRELQQSKLEPNIFFIVPYAFRDLEFNSQYDYFKLKKTFNSTEEKCAHIFLDNNPDENGVIGKRSIQGGGWVSRTPASIYWAGLRKYGILKERCLLTITLNLLLYKNRTQQVLLNKIRLLYSDELFFHP